jgi:hypothetical protein
MENTTCLRHVTFKAKKPKNVILISCEGRPAQRTCSASSTSSILEILGGGRWLVTIGQLVCGGFSFLVVVGRFFPTFGVPPAIYGGDLRYISFPVNQVFLFFFFRG